MSNATITETNKNGFEVKTCSRCGGSGHYSYCERYGSMCFGCQGKGYQLTKRGAAAAEMFSASLRVKATDVQVGTKVMCPASPISAGYWMTVGSVERHVSAWRITNRETGEKTPIESISFSNAEPTNGHEGFGVSPTDDVRVAWSAEEKQAKLADAIAYQATLTKTGQPRKR